MIPGTSFIRRAKEERTRIQPEKCSRERRSIRTCTQNCSRRRRVVIELIILAVDDSRWVCGALLHLLVPWESRKSNLWLIRYEVALERSSSAIVDVFFRRCKFRFFFLSFFYIPIYFCKGEKLKIYIFHGLNWAIRCNEKIKLLD